MKHRFKLPIGDWSDDGHGKHKDYLIESNKPIEEIRELYFQACKKIGFTLDGHHSLTPCGEYEEYCIKPSTAQKLVEFGVYIETEDLEGKRNTLEFFSQSEEEDNVMDTGLFCEMVLSFIKTQDSELELTILPEEKIPMFQFYGYDSQKRHIGYFGYGLFN